MKYYFNLNIFYAVTTLNSKKMRPKHAQSNQSIQSVRIVWCVNSFRNFDKTKSKQNNRMPTHSTSLDSNQTEPRAKNNKKKSAYLLDFLCVFFSPSFPTIFFDSHSKCTSFTFFFVISGSEKFYLPSYRTLPTRVRVWHKKNGESSFAPRGATMQLSNVP